MLVFNFRKVIRMKGINKPYACLVKGGLNGTAATNIIHNRLKLISPEVIEKICMALGCVPHDFMEWRPDKPEQKNHPLKALISEGEVIYSLAELMKDFPASKVGELVRMAEELKK